MNTEATELHVENSNSANNVYVVDARATKLSIPRKCTSCLESTQFIEKLSTYHELLNVIQKKENTYYKTPVCSKCLKIRHNHRKQIILLCCMSIIIPYISFIIASAITDGYLPYIIATAFTALVFWGKALLSKTKDIGNACTRLKSAKVKRISKRKVAFTFSNKEYADLFYEANSEYASPVQVRKGKNTKDASTLLGAMPYPAFIYIICLAVTMFLSAYTMPIIDSIESFDGSTGMSPSRIAMQNKAANSIEKDVTVEVKRDSKKEDKSSDSAALSETSEPQIVPFSADLEPGTLAYADVVSIVPATNLSDPATGGSWAICKCVTAEDKVVYIGLSSKDYISLIDSTANLANPRNATFKTVTYSPAKRFSGTIAQAEAVCRGLSQAIGTSVVMDFVSMD
ncbi:MAG: hypothetical protein J6B23_03490 [Clostridia bacterium]|nr:hypothetical protein [Clostridia bacterium]